MCVQLKRILKVSNQQDISGALKRLKGKKIQVVTTGGAQIRGTVHSVGKDFVIINGHRVNSNGLRTSQLFPFFFPFPSLIFFAPFFFRRRFFFFQLAVPFLHFLMNKISPLTFVDGGDYRLFSIMFQINFDTKNIYVIIFCNFHYS